MRLVARYARGPFDEFVKFTHCATPPTKGHCQYESYVSNALREGVQRGEGGEESGCGSAVDRNMCGKCKCGIQLLRQLQGL